ncbi:transmembrane protein 202-like isoform X2 [Prionailurus bengalensis]|uniref:transmembrane protein 202-like isoform X2 n=1 Tax=Prionailurus bengalensis TaxID=37029 RepID=UPI001CA9CA41|nr:transmembrane protein 202-like isoform X2 [Prionailurus bengalensis]
MTKFCLGKSFTKEVTFQLAPKARASQPGKRSMGKAQRSEKRWHQAIIEAVCAQSRKSGCVKPLPWELCSATTPLNRVYYLQYSRTFFLISIFSILVALGWLISSCLPRRGSTTTNFDLKVSILSFISAISLLLCLILFLAQVYRHTKDALEPDLLWAYHINWWSDCLFTFSGIMSLLNYITFRFPPLDQNVTASPTEKSRLGVGPVTKELPAEDEGLRSDMEAPTEEEKTAPEAEP